MNLPLDFQHLMINDLGKEEFDQLAEALSLPAPTSVRINTDKAKKEELPILDNAESVPWCKNGYYLPERPQFTFDPLFHAGCYYVQEASSMFLAHVLQQYVKEPVKALDLCAAPGGKSTLALSLLPQGSLLIANEAMRQRANILAENITKWGNPNCIVTNNYAEDFQAFSNVFDLIICDAPCSGEGMFRKDINSIDEWSLANVEVCWKRQRDIVSSIWHTLKEGGLFIYSTCTYNKKEDEENAAWIAETLGADILSCFPAPDWSLTATNTHFYPHRTRGEGFFISILRKSETDEDTPIIHRKKKEKKDTKKTSVPKIPTELKGWLTSQENFSIFEEKDSFYAFPTEHLDLYRIAKNDLKILYAGIELATLKGKNLQPCQNLAMSYALNKDAFPIIEADEQQAIAYLRTEALQLPSDTPKGYVLICYQGHPLGFAKNIGNRANNLYPTEWRIRKN
jgi:16S rRNA C967 or C1407 C5-methylase (RsmB/RsmF family)/NOL1/NOP2/fmu family ribosome biogenesis protein